MHHVGPIAGVAAHGPWVATAGYDNRLILWDAATRTALARANHDHLVNACAFSHDGTRLVSAGADHTARIWSLPGLKLEAVLAGHDDDVDMAQFAPGDRLVATCALDRMVRVFDARGALLHALAGHTGNILSLAWIDARRFVTSSVDGTLREWDAEAGTPGPVVDLGMRSDCVEVAPDGRIFACDDLGRIVVLAQGQPPLFVPGHTAGIKKLVIAPDGGQLVTLGYDRAIATWDIANGAPPRETARGELPPTAWARSAAFMAGGGIAIGTFGGTFARFDPAGAAWDLDGVAAGPAINAICPLGGGVATIGDAGRLRIDGQDAGGPGTLSNFLVAVGERLFTGGHLGALADARSGAVLHRHRSPLNCAVTFTHAGLTMLAVGTYTGEILVFALGGGQPILVRTLAAHANAVKGLAFGDGVLFSASANTDLAWHRPGDWAEVRRQPRAHTRIANAVCALADGGFASVGRDRVLRLWLPGGDSAHPTGHPNSVKCMAASPCGRWIATGSYGGTVAVFDRRTQGFGPVRRVAKAGVSALCWSADGFVAATYDGAVLPLGGAVADALRIAA